MSKKNYTFSLSKDIISISKERAKEERRSLSNLVEVALESYINGARASKADNPNSNRPIEESNKDKLCQCSDSNIKYFIKNWCDDCEKPVTNEESNEDKTLKEKLEKIFENSYYCFEEYRKDELIEDIVELIESNEQSVYTACHNYGIPWTNSQHIDVNAEQE